MRTTPAKPAYAIRIDNFAEFREDIRRFAEGKYNFLLVLGNTGLSKTETVKEMVKHCCVFEGGCPTAFHFYCELYRNRDAFVVLDDVSPRFYKDHHTNSYLKQLTNTRAQKTLRWPTSFLSPTTDPPNRFDTTSRVRIGLLPVHFFHCDTFECPALESFPPQR